MDNGVFLEDISSESLENADAADRENNLEFTAMPISDNIEKSEMLVSSPDKLMLGNEVAAELPSTSQAGEPIAGVGVDDELSLDLLDEYPLNEDFTENMEDLERLLDSPTENLSANESTLFKEDISTSRMEELVEPRIKPSSEAIMDCNDSKNTSFSAEMQVLGEDAVMENENADLAVEADQCCSSVPTNDGLPEEARVENIFSLEDVQPEEVCADFDQETQPANVLCGPVSQEDLEQVSEEMAEEESNDDLQKSGENDEESAEDLDFLIEPTDEQSNTTTLDETQVESDKDVGYEADTEEKSNMSIIELKVEQSNPSKRSERSHPVLLAMHDSEIREGEKYQCDDSKLEKWPDSSELACDDDMEQRETCIWLPHEEVKDDEMINYLSVALGVYGIDQDRAMYILMKADYDTDEAKQELEKRRIFKERWCEHDIALFKQCFRYYGKKFRKYRKALPEKTVGELVEFYYNNKRLMNFANLYTQEYEDSDSQAELPCTSRSSHEQRIGDCDNCGKEDIPLRAVDETDLCADCHLHFVTLKCHKPCAKSYARVHVNQKATCPPGMEENVRSFAEFVSTNSEEYEEADGDGADDDIQVVVDRKRVGAIKIEEVKKEVSALRSRCFRLEHDLRLQYKQRLANGIDKWRLPPEPETKRVRSTHNWEYKEKFFAFYAFERYGKDFEAIASLIGTKSADEVKCFYSKYSKEIDQAYTDREAKFAKMMKEHDFDRILKFEEPKYEIVDLE